MQVERFSKSPKTMAVRLAGLRSCSISELKQQWRTIGRQELFVTNLLFEVVEQRRHLFVECLLDRDFVGLAVHEATPDHARKKIFAPVTGESPPSPNSSYQSACAYWYGSEGFRQGWRALVRPRV